MVRGGGCRHYQKLIFIMFSGLVANSGTLLHGYANPLKMLDTSESINLHKCLILLDSCRIHATRCLHAANALATPAPRPAWSLACAGRICRWTPASTSFASARVRPKSAMDFPPGAGGFANEP